MLFPSENPIIDAPNLSIAVSKDNLVRVEASKKQMAMILFFNNLR